MLSGEMGAFSPSVSHECCNMYPSPQTHTRHDPQTFPAKCSIFFAMFLSFSPGFWLHNVLKSCGETENEDVVILYYLCLQDDTVVKPLVDFQTFPLSRLCD